MQRRAIAELSTYYLYKTEFVIAAITTRLLEVFCALVLIVFVICSICKVSVVSRQGLLVFMNKT